ncbi:hypothetical protein [Psychroserpens ponticola]|uniref:Uncharacterized protein n=1 Tax=Psychroserpens ponticola TaxID=2932268 RepID=A0ABY7RUV4_9FLAO|nr:hypothetical protein [Psychroserpens ponticola]WCO00598.1 hypothetical protein MUN68_011030 [Psychroserpens ponticola]
MIIKLKNFKFLTLALIFVLPVCVNSQDFKESINDISSKLESVEASKAQFSQELKDISSGYAIATITEIDTKGESEGINYEFSFSDVDINTVRTITKKDVILVQLLIKGKQKLIKKIEDGGDKVSYVDELFFYAKDIDNGRDIVDSIKNIIPLNETIEKNKLSLTTYSEHLQWLMDNVSEVDYLKKQYSQKLSNDGKQNGHAKLETTESVKSKMEVMSYEFNFAVLNPNSINFKIRSDEFYIEVENRRNIKSIKTFDNNVQGNFTNSLEFYASSVENGKDIYKVLKAIIPLAEKAFSDNKPNIATKTNAIDYLNKVMANISTTDKAITQTIKNECVTDFNQKIATSKDIDDNVYTFNFIDINSDNIEYNSQQDLLFVEFFTNQKSKYMKYTQNGELQNYKNEIKLYVNSIEEAMIAREAIQTIIKECKTQTKTYSGLSEKQCLDALSEAIGVVKINDDNYDQSIEIIDDEAKTIKFTKVFANAKKSEEQVFEFGIKDINTKSIEMKTSGKNVTVEMSTKYFEKIVKTYEDGEIKSYGNKIIIEASNIENAREILNLFAIATKD